MLGHSASFNVHPFLTKSCFYLTVRSKDETTGTTQSGFAPKPRAREGPGDTRETAVSDGDHGSAAPSDSKGEQSAAHHQFHVAVRHPEAPRLRCPLCQDALCGRTGLRFHLAHVHSVVSDCVERLLAVASVVDVSICDGPASLLASRETPCDLPNPAPAPNVPPESKQTAGPSSAIGMKAPEQPERKERASPSSRGGVCRDHLQTSGTPPRGHFGRAQGEPAPSADGGETEQGPCDQRGPETGGGGGDSARERAGVPSLLQPIARPGPSLPPDPEEQEEGEEEGEEEPPGEKTTDPEPRLQAPPVRKGPNFLMDKFLDPLRPYKCAVCKESFTQKNILLVHYNSVSHLHKMRKASQDPALPPPGEIPGSVTGVADKPFRCATCKVSYNQSSTLEIHMRSVLHQTRSRAAKLEAAGDEGQRANPPLEPPEASFLPFAPPPAHLSPSLHPPASFLQAPLFGPAILPPPLPLAPEALIQFQRPQPQQQLLLPFCLPEFQLGPEVGGLFPVSGVMLGGMRLPLPPPPPPLAPWPQPALQAQPHGQRQAPAEAGRAGERREAEGEAPLPPPPPPPPRVPADVSRNAARALLENFGFELVIQYNEGRQCAQSRAGRAGPGSVSGPSGKLQCSGCCKLFSNTLILKSHEEQVHGRLFPSDELDRYAKRFRESYDSLYPAPPPNPPPGSESPRSSQEPNGRAGRERAEEEEEGEGEAPGANYAGFQLGALRALLDGSPRPAYGEEEEEEEGGEDRGKVRPTSVASGEEEASPRPPSLLPSPAPETDAAPGEPRTLGPPSPQSPAEPEEEEESPDEPRPQSSPAPPRCSPPPPPPAVPDFLVPARGDYPCDQCRLTFPTSELLKEHQRLHYLALRGQLLPRPRPPSRLAPFEPGSPQPGGALKRKLEAERPAAVGVQEQAPGPGAGRGLEEKEEEEEEEEQLQPPRDKRLRTTILPEQLEILYQRYIQDSNPTRKVLDRVSQEVGLKKRVVQVWFQNTRARERKGQFRFVGPQPPTGGPQFPFGRCPAPPPPPQAEAQLHPGPRFPPPRLPETESLALEEWRRDLECQAGMLFGPRFLGGAAGGGGGRGGGGGGESPPADFSSSSSSSSSSPAPPPLTDEGGRSDGEASDPAAAEGPARPGEGSSPAGGPGSSSPPASGGCPASPLPAPARPAEPEERHGPRRYRTQMSSLQLKVMKSCFQDYRTPTMLECQLLGDDIGLPKRVVQVWFQNARAKEKKFKQHGAKPSGTPKSGCALCGIKYGAYLAVRNHVFSLPHIAKMKELVRGQLRHEKKYFGPASARQQKTAVEEEEEEEEGEEEGEEEEEEEEEGEGVRGAVPARSSHPLTVHRPLNEPPPFGGLAFPGLPPGLSPVLLPGSGAPAGFTALTAGLTPSNLLGVGPPAVPPALFPVQGAGPLPQQPAPETDGRGSSEAEELEAADGCSRAPGPEGLLDPGKMKGLQAALTGDPASLLGSQFLPYLIPGASSLLAPQLPATYLQPLYGVKKNLLPFNPLLSPTLMGLLPNVLLQQGLQEALQRQLKSSLSVTLSQVDPPSRAQTPEEKKKTKKRPEERERADQARGGGDEEVSAPIVTVDVRHQLTCSQCQLPLEEEEEEEGEGEEVEQRAPGDASSSSSSCCCCRRAGARPGGSASLRVPVCTYHCLACDALINGEGALGDHLRSPPHLRRALRPGPSPAKERDRLPHPLSHDPRATSTSQVLTLKRKSAY
ncbi:zinc finger homeobox protein 2-like [Heptranchias perlo]|uniref:zinc finger homeobox protein 2-like n=1 Tax=Heptranchias perlo TaxID=212740 RepID=UPI003559A901